MLCCSGMQKLIALCMTTLAHETMYSTSCLCDSSCQKHGKFSLLLMRLLDKCCEEAVMGHTTGPYQKLVKEDAMLHFIQLSLAHL